MSQSNKGGVPTLKIKTREPGKISTGANTLVYLDDKLLPASFLKIEFNAKKLTKVLIEMYVNVDVEIDTDLRLISLDTKKTYVKGKASS